MVLTSVSKSSYTDILSVADVKTHLGIFGTLSDDYIGKLIARAFDYIETELGKDFVTSTWDYSTPHFEFSYSPTRHHVNSSIFRHEQLWHPAPAFVLLPRAPVRSITTAKYYDTTNTQQDLTYRLVGDTLEFDTMPFVYRRGDAIQVRFVSGFTTLPPRAEELALLLCGTWYASREDEAVGAAGSPGFHQLGRGIDALLGQLRKGNYA